MENTELKSNIYQAILGEVGNIEAERLSNMAASLHEEMKCREVSFSFVKKDGTIRNAIGTLMEDALPKIEEGTPPSTRTREPNYSTLTYFDVQKQSWRSFRIANLASVEI